MTPAAKLPRSVLIANRGEIAVRVSRAARDLGIRSIAVYHPADVGALHTRVADEAWSLPRGYLDIPGLLDIAVRSGADAVHPGYGFLSESAEFARAVTDAGLTWIGPPAEVIEALGDKVSARKIAEAAGAPLAPGTPDPINRWEEARDFADVHGLPIAIKAAFGGGGRGLKVVENREDIEEAFASAGREAAEAFGRAECFVEKFLVHPRHVEAQVLADVHGHVVVVGTRDCSTQRRFQKLIEEAPAPFLIEEQRSSIVEGAREISRQVGYVGAGTVEFIVAEDGTVSFLEVNTRVQVEHPVTEAVTGVDIVMEQFRAAAGLPLTIDRDPVSRGHAFEFRINAEDVAHGFVPAPGTITAFSAPTGPGIRVDSGVTAGSEVPGLFDSLLAKLVVWGPDREVTLRRAADALREFTVSGVRTTLPFHRDMLDHPELTGPRFGVYTDWVDREWTPRIPVEAGGIESAYTERTTLAVEIDGRLHSVGLPTALLSAGAPAGPADAGGAQPSGGGSAARPAGSVSGGEPATAPASGVAVPSPYTGSLVTWHVADGDEVDKDQKIATIEAMKMESQVTATVAGRISLARAAGDPVAQGEAIAYVTRG